MKNKGLIAWGSIVLLSVVWAFLPESTGSSIAAVFRVGGKSLLEKVEDQADQGNLALEQVDTAYRKAAQKLAALKALKLDARVSLQQAETRAADYERKEKLDLASGNREQAEFFRAQYENYDRAIVSRTRKLQEIGVLRSRAREDVRLAREKIAYLKATKDALDDEGGREILERAGQLIGRMRQTCNRMQAEMEVMNMEE